MDTEFTLTPTSRDGIAVLVLEGELDLITAPTLVTALAEHPRGQPIIVDLTQLTFIDSAGIHAILSRNTAGPTAVVRTPASNVGRVLELVHAETVIPVHDDLVDAVRALSDSCT